MKRVACLLTSFLVLFWASSGIAAAQSLSGLTGPLDDVVDEVSKHIDKVKEPVEEVTKVIKEPVEEVTKVVKEPVEEVTKVVDKVAEEVTEVAKNPAGSGGSVGNKPKPAPAPESAAPLTQTKPADPSSGSSDADEKIARTANRSGKASKGGRAEPKRDTEEVAAVGNTIEPAQVKGTQIIAPATEVDESEGSGLSRTGVQILTWLIVACWLLGTGSAFFLRGRARVRAARS